MFGCYYIMFIAGCFLQSWQFVREVNVAVKSFATMRRYQHSSHHPQINSMMRYKVWPPSRKRVKPYNQLVVSTITAGCPTNSADGGLTGQRHAQEAALGGNLMELLHAHSEARQSFGWIVAIAAISLPLSGLQMIAMVAYIGCCNCL